MKSPNDEMMKNLDILIDSGCFLSNVHLSIISILHIVVYTLKHIFPNRLIFRFTGEKLVRININSIKTKIIQKNLTST